MTSLDDLRATLADHAEEAERADPRATAGRTRAVHRRIRVTRRRRTALVGGTAVAAVVAAVAVAYLPTGGGRDAAPAPSPERAELNGLAVPETLTALGYTFRYDGEGVEGVGEGAIATLEVEPEARPRLLAWGAPGGGLKLAGPGDLVWTTDRGDFSDFVLVPPGAKGTYQAFADDAAIAVYDLDATITPEGATEDGVTFRRHVGSRELVGADFGGSRLDLGYALPPDGALVSASYFCTGAPQGTWVQLRVGGAAPVSQECTDSVFDPGAEPAFTRTGPLAGVGGTTPARLWLTDGPTGEPVSPEGARTGVALYADPEPIRVGDCLAPQVQEALGHPWSLVDRVASRGETTLRFPVPGSPALHLLAICSGNATRVDPGGSTSMVTLPSTQELTGRGGLGTAWAGPGGGSLALGAAGDAPLVGAGIALYARTD